MPKLLLQSVIVFSFGLLSFYFNFNYRSVNLFAFPAQSNFSGCKYPLEWIDEVKYQGISCIAGKL